MLIIACEHATRTAGYIRGCLINAGLPEIRCFTGSLHTKALGIVGKTTFEIATARFYGAVGAPGVTPSTTASNVGSPKCLCGRGPHYYLSIGIAGGSRLLNSTYQHHTF